MQGGNWSFVIVFSLCFLCGGRFMTLITQDVVFVNDRIKNFESPVT